MKIKLKNRSLKRTPFSKGQLLFFALAFAAIGGYIIWRSFAAADTTPPTVSVHTDPISVTNVGGIVSLQAKAADEVGGSGMAGVQFLVNGAPVGPLIPPPAKGFYNFDWDSTPLGDSQPIISAMAYDNAGNHAPAADFKITLDNSAPTVTLVSPGSAISGTVSLEANVTDNVGVTWVHFILDSNENLSVDCPTQLLPAGSGCLFLGTAESNSLVPCGPATPFTMCWDTTKFPNGAHKITAVAYDAARNKTTSNEINLTINNGGSPPTLQELLVKNIYQINNQWGCGGDIGTLDSVTVLMLDRAIPQAHDDAIGTKSCIGVINKITVVQYFADGIKLGGGPNFTINSGTIRCYSHGPGAHQDGLQSLSGYYLTIHNLDIRCYTSDNAQWFMSSNPHINPPAYPDHVVCDTCVFGRGASSTFFVSGSAVASGARNTQICHGINHTKRLPPAPTDAIDINNTVLPDDNTFCGIPAGIYRGQDAPPPTDLIPPSVPMNLRSTDITTTTISLTWDASADEPGGSGLGGYLISRDDVPIDATSSTSYTDTGLDPDTTYVYTIAAYDNANNTSDDSTPLSALTLSPPPPPPEPPQPNPSPPTPTGKIGDLNNDSHVDILDLSILLSHYGGGGTGDIDGQHGVDVVDLSILLSHYGT